MNILLFLTTKMMNIYCTMNKDMHIHRIPQNFDAKRAPKICGNFKGKRNNKIKNYRRNSSFLFFFFRTHFCKNENFCSQQIFIYTRKEFPIPILLIEKSVHKENTSNNSPMKNQNNFSLNHSILSSYSHTLRRPYLMFNEPSSPIFLSLLYFIAC